VLCVLLDLAWATTGGVEPAEQERVLLDELGRYEPALLDRPRLIIGSRVDMGEPDPSIVLSVSAVTGEGLPVLVGKLADLVREARANEPIAEAFVVHRPAAEGFKVEAVPGDQGGGWRVVGRQAERAVALSDLTNADALAYAQSRLRSIGVDKALVRAGVKPGETVRIGGMVFDYEPDDVYEATPGRRTARQRK
jgi:GTP-binding protein